MLSKMAVTFALLLALVCAAPISADELSQAVSDLSQKSLSQKEAAVDRIANEKAEIALPIFKAMLDSRLYYRENDQQVVFADEVANGYETKDIFSSQSLGVLAKDELKKITINNKIRGKLRDYVARLSLESANPKVRLEAAKAILSNVDASYTTLIDERLPREDDAVVRQTLLAAKAVIDLLSGDEALQLKSIAVLRENLEPEIRAALYQLYSQPDHASYAESAVVRKAAQQAVSHIDHRVENYQIVETVLFGLSLGAVLLLAAIGLAITFGVMGVINMAHGELMMIGAYTTYVVQLMMPNYIEYSLLVAVPLAFVVAGLFGIAIERGVIRFLYGRPLETLLATFGISLLLQQLARTIFSPLNRSVETPQWMSGAFEINSVLAITYSRLYIILFAIIIFVLLLLLMKKTSLGLKVRAVSQNRAMARSMGIKSDWIDALTFGLGAGIAGVAGVALSQLTNVGPNMGQAYIIDSFMVVVFGGVGNLWGTLVAAFSLGVANKFLEPWTGAVLAKILVLIFIILFIQKRPKGLFPQKGRVVED